MPNKVQKRALNQRKIGYIQEKSSMCPIKSKNEVKSEKNWAYRGEKFYVPNKVQKRALNQRKIGYIQEKSSMCPIKFKKGVKIRKNWAYRGEKFYVPNNDKNKSKMFATGTGND